MKKCEKGAKAGKKLQRLVRSCKGWWEVEKGKKGTKADWKGGKAGEKGAKADERCEGCEVW